MVGSQQHRIPSTVARIINSIRLCISARISPFLPTLPTTSPARCDTATFLPKMSNQYDSQASTNYKEAFALFDKRGNGRVALDSLGDLLRACGQNPTLAEIQDLEKNVGGECELDPPPAISVYKACADFANVLSGS